MADQPKKARTAAQAARNLRQKEVVAALRAAQLKVYLPNVSEYLKREDAALAQRGKDISEEEKARIKENIKPRLLEEIREIQAAREAAPKVPKKATAAVAVAVNAGPKAGNGNGNGTRNNKPKAAANGKVRTQKQLNADKKMRNMKAAFNAHNIKYGAASMKYFAEQKKAKRANDEIYAEMKGMFPKFEVNASGAKKPIVTKRAVTVKKANAAPKAANVVGVAAVGNAGVAKGMYVCEKCRLVANNTRKNNKGNGRNAPNFTYGFYE